jgi:hypothetical protein
MFTDKTGYIYCFRDINSKSLNDDMYTFNINWRTSSEGELKIYTSDICILYPNTVQQYAIETPVIEFPETTIK